MAQINLTVPSPDKIQQRWGSDFDCQVFHLKRHPSASTDERLPVVVYVPGAVTWDDDGRSPFCANGDGNWLFDHLQSYTTTRFACIGLTGPTFSMVLNDLTYDAATGGFTQSDVVGNSHNQGLAWPLPQQNPLMPMIQQVQYLKLFIMVLKSRAEEYKIDPNKIFLFGFETGGTKALLSQLTGEETSETITKSVRTHYGISPGVDSKVAGIINYAGITEFRNSQSYIASVAPQSNTNNTMAAVQQIRNLPASTAAQLAALPSHHYQQISVNWYIENKKNLNKLPPVYNVYPWRGHLQQRGLAVGTVIGGANITAGGSAYINGDTVSLNFGNGSLATATAAVTSGAITSLTVATSGTYNSINGQTYNANGTVSGFSTTYAVTGGTGNGATFSLNNVPLTLGTTYDAALPLGQNFDGVAALTTQPSETFMLLMQRAVQLSGVPVAFRYATPYYESISDTYSVASQSWVSDVSFWMTSVLLENALIGPAPTYYGRYFSTSDVMQNTAYSPISISTNTTLFAYPPKWWGSASVP